MTLSSFGLDGTGRPLFFSLFIWSILVFPALVIDRECGFRLFVCLCPFIPGWVSVTSFPRPIILECQSVSPIQQYRASEMAMPLVKLFRYGFPGLFFDSHCWNLSSFIPSEKIPNLLYPTLKSSFLFFRYLSITWSDISFSPVFFSLLNCSLRIRTLRGAFNIRYATRYAALFIPSFNTHGEEKSKRPIL